MCLARDKINDLRVKRYNENGVLLVVGTAQSDVYVRREEGL